MAARSSLPENPAKRRLLRLKTRAEFLKVQRGARRATPSLTLEACRGPDDSALRVGFTASRKIGNAVTRNRAKRRLRAAAAEVLPKEGRAGFDYVLVARAGTLSEPYGRLVADLASALALAHVRLEANAGTA
ncbi:MAG: ribonuclease P protein component [Alphaproteobacteria bacterium]|nr:ribonuclease P protein component [Alphaproteobacteria bacterium]MBV9692558.1 ribonuclease P protein component [Alphaproteobacteria bacterium]